MKYILPTLVFTFFMLNEKHGLLTKSRVCEQKSFITEMITIAHAIITTYSLTSPFVLKDYFSNMMFNMTLLILWYIENVVNRKVICPLSYGEDVQCKNKNILLKDVTPIILWLVIGVILYDLGNILWKYR